MSQLSSNAWWAAMISGIYGKDTMSCPVLSAFSPFS